MSTPRTDSGSGACRADVAHRGADSSVALTVPRRQDEPAAAISTVCANAAGDRREMVFDESRAFLEVSLDPETQRNALLDAIARG